MEKYLGKNAIDPTTGFEGVITAVAVYDTGITLFLIENIDSTGRPIENWFDKERVCVVEE